MVRQILLCGLTLNPRWRSSSKRPPVAVEGGTALGEQEVSVVFEAAFGSKLRLQQAERSGSGIARIGEAGESLCFAVGIEAFESAAAHDGFAANLKGGRRFFT